jgi:hypothetical protein
VDYFDKKCNRIQIGENSSMNDMTAEKALAGGDLSGLTEDQRAALVIELCKHLGIKAITSPFGFFRDDVTNVLKVVIRKAGIEQLRETRGISVTDMHVQLLGDVIVYIVHGEAPQRVAGQPRKEVASGTMSLEGLIGPEKAKAFLLAETKAKHRLTLALAGIGIGEEPDAIASLAKQYAAEPTKAPEPQVNNAPAIESKDTRPYHGAFPDLTPEQAEAGKTLDVILARGHSFPEPEPEKMAAEMDKSTPIPPNEAVAKPLPKPAPVEESGGFESMFGGDTPVLPIADISESIRSLTPEPRDHRLAPLKIEEVDNVPCDVAEPATATSTGEPKLTPIEFKAFTARCTKLVRDVLPKVNKEAPSLLLPFLRRRFGTNDIQAASATLWESTLSHIESAPNADKLAILKGK